MNRLLQIAAAISLCCGLGLDRAELAAARAKVPTWVIQAEKQKLSDELRNEKNTHGKPPSVAVLLDSASYTIKNDGTKLITKRKVIRILNSDGLDEAVAEEYYYVKGRKIKRLRAWVLEDGKKPHVFKPSDQTDSTTSRYRNYLYSDGRVKRIDGRSQVRPGSVFAYEAEIEDSTMFSQIYWNIQDSNPVVSSELTITLPADWRLNEHSFHDAPDAQQSENTFSWIAKDVSPTKSEKRAPHGAAQQTQVLVQLLPPENSNVAHSDFNVRTWKDIAAYKAKVQDPAAAPTDEIKTKALEVTAGAVTQWDKLKAISEYMREIEYAFVAYDLANGGGYTPRSAAVTFETGYGDCKDKATLMRALLQSVGIESYAVTINGSHNDRVNPDIPSTYYFNHCIAAIKVDETINAPAVLEDSPVGRLLFVDPTSHATPIGELPFDEQGGYAVLSDPTIDPLIRVPQSKPEDNLEKRVVRAEIFPDGTLASHLMLKYHGDPATDERNHKKYKSEEEYETLQTRWISRGNTGAKLDVLSYTDNFKEDRSIDLEVALAIKSYARSMRGVLLVFKPAIIDRYTTNPFSKKKRTQPIVFRPRLIEEEATFYIPVGFKVDEIGNDVSIEYDFGQYSCSFEVVDDSILYKRRIRMNDMIIDASRYDEVKEFYDRMIEAEQLPIILARD